MLSFTLDNKEEYNKQQLFGSMQLHGVDCIHSKMGWLHKKHFLEHYKLIYVKKGVLHFSLDQNIINIHEEQITICPPYRILRGTTPCEADLTFYSVDFSTNDLGSAQVTFEMETINAPSQIQQYFHEIYLSSRRHGTPPEIAEALFLVILDTLKRQYNQEIDFQTALVDKVCSYIDQNISSLLSVQSVAEAMGYNKDYLSRVVKASTGETLIGLITRHRMNSARILLRSSTYSISSIGNMLGYEDTNLFTKYFQYHQKMSPSQYRKLS